MILISNSKDFLRYIETADRKNILGTQYVLVSTTISKSGRYSNVISQDRLMPTAALLTAYANGGSKSTFKEDYYDHLNNHIHLLATMIAATLDEKYDIIIVCSNKEWKRFGYLKVLKSFIEDKFKYPVYNLGKILNAIEKNEEIVNYAFKEKDVRAKIAKYRKTDAKNKNTKLNRKDMEKKLKKIGLYQKGMSKIDMENIIDIHKD